MVEELRGDDGADRVATDVLGSASAAPVSVEARDRVHAARLQGAPQDIELRHGFSLARGATHGHGETVGRGDSPSWLSESSRPDPRRC